MKKIGLLQSCYIPWKGYFDIIRSVDEFILFDTAQYRKNWFCNRNKIITPNGPLWLTIPMLQPNLSQMIKDAEVKDNVWRIKHWKTLQQSYAKSAYFPTYEDTFKTLYLESEETSLSLINHAFLQTVCFIIDCRTTISWSHDYEETDTRPLDATDRLIQLCVRAEADTYVSGPAAQGYLDESQFEKHGIHIQWMDYNGYPVYRQRHVSFEHQVSIVDLIFNEGPDAVQYMQNME